MSLSIMTYNMANYDDHDNWTTRAQMFRDLIVQHNPDIICFQEDRYNPDKYPFTNSTLPGYLDMAQQVLLSLQRQNYYTGATLIQLPTAYYPLNSKFTVPLTSADAPDGKFVEWEGKAIISKYWVVEQGSLSYTRPNTFSGDLNKRSLQFAAIDLSNGVNPTPNLFYIFNTHFSYDINEGSNNAKLAVQYINEKTKNNSVPYILMGDLNASPEKAPIQILKDSAILTDLWAHMWGNTPGLTFPSNNPNSRIDYMFTCSQLTSLCKSMFVLGNQPNNGVYASDHLGLIATFQQPLDMSDPIEKDFHFVENDKIDE